MRFKKIKIFGVVTWAFLVFAHPAYAQLAAVSGPVSGSHGNPSDCTSCHSGGGFVATAGLSGPASILHGQNSTTFTLSGTGGAGRGFNIAIYRVTGNVKQTTGYNTLDANIYSPFDNGELQHGVAQTAQSWTFKWTAPATLGQYRVYACVNPVNNDGDLTLDGDASCTTHNFNVTNNAPNANNDNPAIIVTEDSGLSATFNVVTNDTSTESDAFSWLSHSTGSVTGILQHNGSGVYQYNPNGQFESLDSGEQTTTSFTYTIRENSYTGATDCNGSPCTDTAMVTIQINGANDAPVAVNDGSSGFGLGYVSVNEGATLTDSGNIASNDTDVDIEILTTFRSGAGVPANCDDVSPSQAASFTLNSNGSFTYQHDGTNTLSGVQDSFSYCAYDGTAYSAPATVYIDIAPQNDAPTIDNSVGSTDFTEQTSVLVDNNIAVFDVETDNLDRGFVTISDAYVPGEDTLGCTVLTGVSSCVFAGGTLTITTVGGGITAAAMESVLEGVQFNSSSDNPALTSKTINFSVRDVNTATSATDSKTVTVARSNDPPKLAPILNQNAFEDTVADPYTFIYTAVASDVDVNDDTNTGDGSLKYTLSVAPVGMAIDNTPANPGRITWNPPITGYPATSYNVTVEIEDDDEDSSAPNSVSFTVTVSPPDDDGDNVENYNDLCLTIFDTSNADNDGDGTSGSNGGANDGGDVCDLDDDNDGMPDSFEDANGFDSLNFADASEDADGDGISNLQEFLDNTSPTAANLVIDATGYLTAYDLNLIAPEPSSIHSDATAVTAIFAKRPTDLANPYGPYRPGDNTITWRASNNTSDDLVVDVPANIVADAPERPFFVRPLVSFAVDQQVEESGSVAVTARLNGDAPVWEATPIGSVTVDYSVSGTASNPDDHSAVSGTLTFIAGDYEEDITFNVTADGIVDPNETIVFKLTNATNAVIGSKKRHTVTIVEENVAPRAALRFRQDIDNDLTSELVGSTYAGSGQISVEALVSDVNTSQSHRYDWSGTDNALLPPGNVDSWSIATPVAGNYRVEVIVTDNGIPARSTQVSRILNVQSGAAIALLNIADTDGDGIKDDVEGYGDDDADGVPNFLDAIDGSGAGSNLIPDQTVDVDDSLLLETEAGLTLRLGSTSVAANRFGALLVNSDIEDFGSERGDAPVNASDDLEHVGGIYDFEIDGLIPGTSSRIVIPLQSAIPKDARYRKYNPATGWSDFVVDANNLIESASGELGACPEPGSSAYRSGLNYLDNCIQLTIQDGGLNDTDNTVNGVVNDPSTVGIELTEPEGFEEVEQGSGGGRVAPLLLAMLLLLGGYAFRRRQRGIRID